MGQLDLKRDSHEGLGNVWEFASQGGAEEGQGEILCGSGEGLWRAGRQRPRWIARTLRRLFVCQLEVLKALAQECCPWGVEERTED